MSITFQPLDEYRKALRAFDWYYDYSDDYGYWARTKTQHDLLWQQARISEDHREVWDEVQAEIRAKNTTASN